ncbi:2-hydroxy-acid oxidase [Catellatospora sp. KI3]|uniref:2-hydroxy-acid oxidase n=1 Tax=Catellatospora sp. KI3 TaxID=3041620 RepID=UPI002482A842|nr:2-hydroxy-acid oxidase [Catellatospora sp. KI3]MDI1463579.1 2-hydroxy-acid oxidase [Catellatospora sp. KI3]
MFTDSAPSRPSPPVDLCVTRMARRTFDTPALLPPEHGDALDAFVDDLVRPYGLAPGGRPAGHSYGEMAAEVVGLAVRPDEPVDLLVLAFAVPDLRPGRATATYLSHVCPGGPQAFAVCDQGSAAAFTALRLAREHLRTEACARVLVLVAEQSGLPYPTAAPGLVPQRHAAVGLLCERTGPTRLRDLGQHPGTDAGQAAKLLLAAVEAAGGGASVVLGSGLADAADAVPQQRLRVAPSGQPLTGVWWALAGQQVGHEVLVADYDPLLGYLSLATFDAGVS